MPGYQNTYSGPVSRCLAAGPHTGALSRDHDGAALRHAALHDDGFVGEDS